MLITKWFRDRYSMRNEWNERNERNEWDCSSRTWLDQFSSGRAEAFAIRFYVLENFEFIELPINCQLTAKIGSCLASCGS